jgi:hypothetical protein
MLLNELIDTFKADYARECVIRKVLEIRLVDKEIGSMLSKVISDLQMRLDIIEASTTITSIAGTATYALPSVVMEVKVVKYVNVPLIKKSTQELEGCVAYQGQPSAYSMLYSGAIPQLFLSNPPLASGDIISINYVPNFSLFSPSNVGSQDFGTYNGSAFINNTVLPPQYDNVLLIGMMMQIFKDMKQYYEEAVSMLRVKQFNGVKFTYSLGYPL